MNTEREIRENLKYPSVPQDVHKLILDTCNSLPEIKVKHRGIKWIKGFSISAVAVAASFMMLFSLNAVNPVFAESLPLVGGLFKQFNGEKKVAVGSNIDSYGQVEQIKDLNLQSGDMSLALTEAYSDGVYIHGSFALEVPKEIMEKHSGAAPAATARVNGEELERAGEFYMLIREDKYIGTCAWKLPKPVEKDQELNFDFAITEINFYGENDRENEVMAVDFKGEHSVNANTEDNKFLQQLQGSGQIQVLKAESTPSHTQLSVKIPYWCDMNELVNSTSLFLPDGTELMRSLQASEIPRNVPMDAETVEMTLFFDGVPKGTDKVIFRLIPSLAYSETILTDEQAKEMVLAELTVNLSDGSYEETNSYLENGYESYDNFSQDYQKISWSLVFDEILNTPDGQQQFSEDELFKTDEYFQKDFTFESLEINSRGELSAIAFKRGDEYRAVSFSVEKDGNVIAQAVTTEKDMHNNSALAACGGDMEIAEKTWRYNSANDEEEYQRYREDGLKAMEKSVSGQKYYSFNTKLTGEAPELMDWVTIKLKDSATGEELFKRDVRLVSSEFYTWDYEPGL